MVTIAIYRKLSKLSGMMCERNMVWVKDVLAKRPHILPAIIAAVMLFIGIFPLPYGYYQFLRWIICGIALFIAYKTTTFPFVVTKMVVTIVAKGIQGIPTGARHRTQ